LAFGGLSAQLQATDVTCAFTEASPKAKMLATRFKSFLAKLFMAVSAHQPAVQPLTLSEIIIPK
jgi:hypothetical protein